MSDTEDASVLGKRTRTRNDEPEQPPPPPPPSNGNENGAENAMDEDGDESDDDVGPMPMPAGEENGVVKKKRKGTHAFVWVDLGLKGWRVGGEC